MKKDNNGKILLAMLAGASAGVIAGILMAPETGEATRGNLKKSASKLSKDLETKLQAGMEQLQTLSTSVSSSAGSLLNKVKGGSGDGGVTNTGSNTTATSHLANNPTGGNIEAAGEATPSGAKAPSKGAKATGGGANTAS